MVIAEEGKEAIFLKNFFNELRLDFKVKIYNDNQNANFLANNSIFHAMSKHIDLRYHFIRDALKNLKFNLDYLPTEHVIADVMAKAVNKSKHWYCVKGVGLKEL